MEQPLIISEFNSTSRLKNLRRLPSMVTRIYSKTASQVDFIAVLGVREADYRYS
jgi:hypothetical protein